jgi:hypothetical protein
MAELFGSGASLSLDLGKCHLIRGTPAQFRYLSRFNGKIKFVSAQTLAQELQTDGWFDDEPIVAIVKDAHKLPANLSVRPSKVGAVLLSDAFGSCSPQVTKLFKSPPAGDYKTFDVKNYRWKEDPQLGPLLKKLSYQEFQELESHLLFPGDLEQKLLKGEPLEVTSSINRVTELLSSVIDGTWPEMWDLTAGEATLLGALPQIENCTFYRVMMGANGGQLSNTKRGLAPDVWLGFELFRKRWENKVSTPLLLKLFAAHLRLSGLHGKGLTSFTTSRNYRLFNYDIELP